MAQKTFSSSATSVGSDEDLVVYCQPCDVDGPRLPAYGYCTDCKKHLCESCFKLHKRRTFPRQHNLLNKDSMPKTLHFSSRSVSDSKSDELTKPCTKHKKEVIKFYCDYHESLLCSVCAFREHTGSSCKVDYIPDISGQLIDSNEYKNFLIRMDTTTYQCQKLSENVKEMTEQSNQSLVDVLAEIKTFRKELNQTLDDLEREVIDTAREIQQENDMGMKIVETTCDDVTKSLKASSDLIKHLNTSKQADELFMELKHAEKMVKNYEISVQKYSEYDLKKFKFQPNETLSNLIEKEKSLGILAGKALKKLPPPPATSVKSKQVSHQGEVCVRTSDDSQSCCVRGMTLLTPDLLIICDSNNMSIKLIDTCSQSVIDQLKLQSRPWDVTLVTNTELAVTLPDSKTIQFMSVSSNKLKKKHTLKVDGYCQGVTCCQGKLVVSYVLPSKLQSLDINGTVLTTVSRENIFQCPEHITSNSSAIYVSDCGKNTVTKLNWQSDVIGSYGNLDYPTGITLTDVGTLFVCNYSRKAIEEISSDFSTGKVVLKDLSNLCAVCWCSETNTLYVSSIFSDSLKFFKLHY